MGTQINSSADKARQKYRGAYTLWLRARTGRDHRTHALLEQRRLLRACEGHGSGASGEVEWRVVLPTLGLGAVVLVVLDLLDLPGFGAFRPRVARPDTSILVALERKHTQTEGSTR
jgi:hypothetical protein